MISHMIFWLLRLGVHPIITDIFLIATMATAAWTGWATAREEQEEGEE